MVTAVAAAIVSIYHPAVDRKDLECGQELTGAGVLLVVGRSS